MIINVSPDNVQRLKCQLCGKSVSTGFIPVWEDEEQEKKYHKTLVIRAFIQCPECLSKKLTEEP